MGIGVLSFKSTLFCLQNDELITFPSAPPSMRIRAGRPLTAPMKVRRRREFLWTEMNEWRRMPLRRRRWRVLLLGSGSDGDVRGGVDGRGCWSETGRGSISGVVGSVVTI